MLTTVLAELKTLLDNLPTGTLPSPHNAFPTGVSVRRGWYPDVAKEATEEITVWVTPSLSDAVTFDPDEDDRCGDGGQSYTVFLGIVKRLVDINPGDVSSDAEMIELCDLSESLAKAVSGMALASGLTTDTPESVIFVDPGNAEKRIFSSWWKLVY